MITDHTLTKYGNSIVHLGKETGNHNKERLYEDNKTHKLGSDILLIMKRHMFEYEHNYMVQQTT